MVTHVYIISKYQKRVSQVTLLEVYLTGRSTFSWTPPVKLDSDWRWNRTNDRRGAKSNLLRLSQSRSLATVVHVEWGESIVYNEWYANLTNLVLRSSHLHFIIFHYKIKSFIGLETHYAILFMLSCCYWITVTCITMMNLWDGLWNEILTFPPSSSEESFTKMLDHGQVLTLVTERVCLDSTAILSCK